MQDEAVGMGTFPAGSGVGGKAGVHHGDGGGVFLRLQVRIEPPQLSHQEQPLVDDGAAGHAHHVGVVVGLFEFPSRHVQLPVEFQSGRRLRRAADEALLDGGHASQCRGAQDLRADGNVPPSQKLHPLFLQDDLQHLLGLAALQRFRGKEEHAHGVIPGTSQCDLQVGGGSGKEAVADLQKDPNAVSRLPEGILAGTVLQSLYDLQGVIHGLMALSAADIHHRSDAAGIPLVDGPVSQPLLVRHHVPVPLFPDAPGSATGGHAGRFFDPFRVINTIKKDTGGQGEALPETSVSSVSYRIPRFERLCQFVKVFKKSLHPGHRIAHIAVDRLNAHVII